MEKVVNYTPEDIKLVSELYAQGKDATEIATITNRSARSIVSKLVQLGLYISKVDDKPKRKTKAELLHEVEQLLGLDPKSLESFEKANADAIKLLHQTITEIKA